MSSFKQVLDGVRMVFDFAMREPSPKDVSQGIAKTPSAEEAKRPPADACSEPGCLRAKGHEGPCCLQGATP